MRTSARGRSGARRAPSHSRRVEHALHRAGRARVQRVVERRHDRADHLAAAAAQRTRGAVRHVAKLGDRVAHEALRRLVDLLGRVEHARDGGRGDAGQPGDVLGAGAPERVGRLGMGVNSITSSQCKSNTGETPATPRCGEPAALVAMQSDAIPIETSPAPSDPSQHARRRVSCTGRRPRRSPAPLGPRGAAGPRQRRATTSRPTARAKINWRQAEGEDDHGRRDPGELLRQPDHAAAAVRGADRHQAALREGAARPDPPEGDARPVVEDRHLRDARRRSDVLPALRREQVGRAARPLPERRRRSPTPRGSTTTTSSRRGATPTRSTASRTAFRTTAR